MRCGNKEKVGEGTDNRKNGWKYQDIRKSVAAVATQAMNREGRCTTLVRPRSSFESIVCRTFRGRCIGYFCRCAAMRHTTQSTFPFLSL